MKTIVKVKDDSFPVRYDSKRYKAGEELEVLSEHADHPDFEVLVVMEPPKRRNTKATATKEAEPN